MCIKSRNKYLLITGGAVIIISLLFCPIHPKLINNETMFSTFAGLTFHDGSIFVSLLVGIGTILITSYSIERSYKTMKLTSLPNNSANLLIDLELLLNEYKNSKRDELSVLTEILKYWKIHQKAFRLLTPCFYKNFLKIITEYNLKNEKTAYNTNYNENYFIKNSEYILQALIAQITNIAFENDECNFSFINPKLIKENINLEELGNDLKNYTTIKMTKNNLNKYIERIPDDHTRTLTTDEFEKLTKRFKNLLKELKREIEEYD